MRENRRWCCRRCNENRADCGHCVGALACATAVAHSTGRGVRQVIRRWRLKTPLPVWAQPTRLSPERDWRD